MNPIGNIAVIVMMFFGVMSLVASATFIGYIAINLEKMQKSQEKIIELLEKIAG